MKKIILSFLTIVMVVGFSNKVMAQTENSDEATANATATIIAPIAIAHSGTDLQFGTIVKAEGTVIIDVDGDRTHNVSAGNLILTTADMGTDVSAAVFTVTGEPEYTFDIDLPGTINITHTDAATTMAVGTFTSTGDIGTGDDTATLDDEGNFDLNVGATLTVGATQKSGLYAGEFTVTVTYN